MAILYASSMDHYGPEGDVAFQDVVGGKGWPLGAAMLGDGWANYPIYGAINPNGYGTYRIATPPAGARQGDYALIADGACIGAGLSTWIETGSEAMGLTIPGSLRHVNLIHLAFYIDTLPLYDKAHGRIVSFLDPSLNLWGSLHVTPTGRLQLVDGIEFQNVPGENKWAGQPNIVLTSSAPVIFAGSWHYLSVQIDTTPALTVGGEVDVSVYVGDITAENLALTGTSAALTATGSNYIASLGILPAGATQWTTARDTQIRAVRDIVLCDTTGAYNNTLLGTCFVSAQEFRDEDTGGGWTAYPRENLGPGILDHATNQTGLRFADSASLEIGALDFTLETFVRFASLPIGPDYATLAGKWREATGYRSYRLYYDGTGGDLVWEVSTDGSTATEVKRVPWEPVLNRYYHVAVVRSANETLFFINGVQLGVPIADTNTYYDGTAYFGVGAAFDASGNPDTTGRFDGWLDETRFTVGVARYTSNFTTPSAKFGRNSTDDADFANVVLLLGYDDTAITDESSYTRVVTLAATDPVSTITPGDGANSYDVLNQRPAYDDTFIEAAYLPAEGIFTFDAVPAAAETMTIGGQTYTWVSAFSGSPANEVLIGADIPECITNIIAAINGGSGAGTLYGTGTVANAGVYALTFLSPQLKVRALTAGAAGNSIDTTETMVNGAFGNATLEGGQDIPADSDFAIERLPRDATGVLGMQVTARTFKTDAGSATMEFDLVAPQGGVQAGTGFVPELNAGWVRQVFEEDPDTAARVTPSTLNAGKIRVKRTA